jgi:hypothetical protein
MNLKKKSYNLNDSNDLNGLIAENSKDLKRNFFFRKFWINLFHQINFSIISGICIEQKVRLYSCPFWGDTSNKPTKQFSIKIFNTFKLINGNSSYLLGPLLTRLQMNKIFWIC